MSGSSPHASAPEPSAPWVRKRPAEDQASAQPLLSCSRQGLHSLVKAALRTVGCLDGLSLLRGRGRCSLGSLRLWGDAAPWPPFGSHPCLPQVPDGMAAPASPGGGLSAHQCLSAPRFRLEPWIPVWVWGKTKRLNLIDGFHAHSMQKFWGRGLNPSHSSSSSNARSLTAGPPESS